MTPTNELRFVERTIFVNAAVGELKYSQNIRVLQQKWATPYVTRADQYGNVQHSLSEPIEWRDVPCVKED